MPRSLEQLGKKSHVIDTWIRTVLHATNPLIFIATLLMLLGAATQAQESTESETSLPKVLLRWKFKAGQVFHGKLALGFQTTDERSQQTNFINDFTWEVQSIRDDGMAVIQLTIPRQRFTHRSDLGRVEYDSMRDSDFTPSEVLLNEVKKFVDVARKTHNRQYLFLFSDRGEVQALENYENLPTATTVLWPKLPDDSIGVGDRWTIQNKDRDDDQYHVTSIEKIDNETIVSIEHTSDTSRCRFAVESGKFIDETSWQILATGPDAPKSIVQSISQRRIITRQDAPNPTDQLKPLQPNQPGRALHMIRRSAYAVDDLEEHILGEKNAVRSIQHNLFIEHITEFDMPDNPEQWSPIDWLIVARYFERIGNLEKRNELLKTGAASIALAIPPEDLRGNLYLLQFAELLAEAGEFEHAIKACKSINLDASSGLSLTMNGPVKVPKSAMLNYALILVARQQAMSGHSEDATSTAKMISQQSARSAAHWVVAMQLADRGEIDIARENIHLAEKGFTPKSSIIEFGKEGPSEVPVQNYRTLALGKMAIFQGLHEDVDGMNESLNLIQNETEKNAVLIDLIVALEKRGAHEFVEKLIGQLPKNQKEIAITYRISTRLEMRNVDSVEQWIESIADPILQAEKRIHLCRVLVSMRKQSENPQNELDRAWLDTQNTQVTKTLDLIEKCHISNAEKTDLRIQVAALVARNDVQKIFEELTSKIEGSINRLPKAQQSRLNSKLVIAYLIRGQMSKAQSVAERIQDPSERVIALTAIAKRFANDFEFEKSREVFPKAYEAAMQVDNILGLDTLYSKGGAIRYVGRQQGECDLEGLINYLQDSQNANLRSYGYIGGVEALDPKAAEAATKLGRIPDGILRDACETSLACKILTQQPRQSQGMK